LGDKQSSYERNGADELSSKVHQEPGMDNQPAIDALEHNEHILQMQNQEHCKTEQTFQLFEYVRFLPKRLTTVNLSLFNIREIQIVKRVSIVVEK